ncbi:unnamed protein product [Meganyctiphanes norvegica]|uniref:Uncharacterized protein n=1 Tax=Meganyctiphanes norvegica TaxID=48144 RepID=A0AAV2RC06_MEGNR
MKSMMLMLCACIALFSSTAYGSCKIRVKKERALFKTREEASMCQPHRLPVPMTYRNFTRLNPSVEFVKRCDENLFCSERRMKCLPSKIKGRTVKASGFDEKMNPQCVKITVDEHQSCSCQCPGRKMCNPKQEFDDTFCECQCKKDVQENCSKRRKRNPTSNLMLDPDTCECMCNDKKKECGTGEFFSDEICDCKIIIKG